MRLAPSPALRRLRPSSRSGRAAVGGLVVLGLVTAGTATYAVASHTVSLDVEGEAHQVRTFGGTVADVLATAGVAVGEHDVVSPSASTEIQDGTDVVVRFGREVALTVDGQTRTVWTTARTVDSALADIGVRSAGAAMSVSRSARISRNGIALDLTTPKQVQVHVDGATRTPTTTAATVADLLDELDVEVRPDDRLSATPDTPVVAGLAVAVTRMDVRRGVAVAPIPAPVQERDSDQVLVGQTRVQAQGADGEMSTTYDETLANGVVVHRADVGQQVTREPVARVVLRGTRPVPAPAPRAPARGPSPSPSPAPPSSGGGGSVPGADSLNWGALAQCESGGRATVVSANGLYHGLYQFSTSTWRSVGGSGVASQASPDEQTYRAKLLYNRSGAGQWPSCGPRLFS